mmetsp:Transcript_63646/g.175598  ORF Transcript_63646/g.175598 Transcript_63646/m.175598 type:complete len:100 (+) Transcript_63646:799-1098(+)
MCSIRLRTLSRRAHHTPANPPTSGTWRDSESINMGKAGYHNFVGKGAGPDPYPRTGRLASGDSVDMGTLEGSADTLTTSATEWARKQVIFACMHEERRR